LQPISWIRWSVATLIIVVVVVGQLRDPSTVAYPFAGEAIGAGTEITAAAIEWRDVPDGLLPDAELIGIARTDIAIGAPITPDRLATTPLVPPDWWTIELPVGRIATVGAAIRIVVLEPNSTVTGVLTALPQADPFGGELLGTVAIPPDTADLVARAAAIDAVVTMVGTGP
jgi:hypothetical protein